MQHIMEMLQGLSIIGNFMCANGSMFRKIIIFEI